MNKSASIFPSEEEFGEICRRFPLAELMIPEESSVAALCKVGASPPLADLEVQDWVMHLANRMIHARNAFHLMVFYISRGIQDEPHFISPGRDGASVEYFPNLTDAGMQNKAWFDMYADLFAYKLFSAWDCIGQTLNAAFGLQIARPSFIKVAKALKRKRYPMGTELVDLWNRQEFHEFRVLRHNATHNFLPGGVGGSVEREQTLEWFDVGDGLRVLGTESVAFGVGRYTPCRDIMRISQRALGVFSETLVACGLRSSS